MSSRHVGGNAEPNLNLAIDLQLDVPVDRIKPRLARGSARANEVRKLCYNGKDPELCFASERMNTHHTHPEYFFVSFKFSNGPVSPSISCMSLSCALSACWKKQA